MSKKKRRVHLERHIPIIIILLAIIGAFILSHALLLPQILENYKQQPIICPANYFQVGQSCCLDADKNGICDNDEEDLSQDQEITINNPEQSEITEKCRWGNYTVDYDFYVSEWSYSSDGLFVFPEDGLGTYADYTVEKAFLELHLKGGKCPCNISLNNVRCAYLNSTGHKMVDVSTCIPFLERGFNVFNMTLSSMEFTLNYMQVYIMGEVLPANC